MDPTQATGTGASPGLQFLVIGVGRGGTSLLAGMLDYNSKLHVDFEHEAKATLVFAEPQPGIDRLTSRSAAFRAACDAKAAQHVGQIYGNKITTEQILALHGWGPRNPAEPEPVLRHFFDEAMSGAKVVFIVRDGRTCVRSKVNRKGMTPGEACQLWQYGVGVLRFLRARGERLHEVRYEDLVEDPERVLRGVCGFLGVPFEEGMLEGVGNPQMQPTYRQGEVDASKLDLAGVPPGTAEILDDELRELGYVG